MVGKKKPAQATKQGIQRGDTPLRGDIWVMKEAVQTMNGNIRILKGDIQMVRGDLQKLEKRMDTKMGQLEERMDTKIDQLEERMDTKMDAKFEKFAEIITQHMNVVAENLVHDFNGIFKDRLEQHEDRITRLEEHTGLARV